MSIKQWLTCFLGIGFVTGCGYRTPPSPYPDPVRSTTLSAITDTKVIFREDLLLLTWKSPLAAAFPEHAKPKRDPLRSDADSSHDAKIATPAMESPCNGKSTGESKEETNGTDTYGTDEKHSPAIRNFRISLLQPTSCYACPDKVLASLFVHAADNRILNERGEVISDPPLLQTIFVQDGKWQLIISPEYLAKLHLPDRYYFSIDYLTDKGEISMATKPLTPIRPLTIPAPRVKVRVIGLSDKEDNRVQQKFKETFESGDLPCRGRLRDADEVWILEWNPVLETIRHTVQADGKLEKTEVVYGLQFFYYDDNQYEIPYHRELLFEGSYAVFDFHGILYARHVDRFGNQSAKVKVYAGYKN